MPARWRNWDRDSLSQLASNALKDCARFRGGPVCILPVSTRPIFRADISQRSPNTSNLPCCYFVLGDVKPDRVWA